MKSYISNSYETENLIMHLKKHEDNEKICFFTKIMLYYLIRLII